VCQPPSDISPAKTNKAFLNWDTAIDSYLAQSVCAVSYTLVMRLQGLSLWRGFWPEQVLSRQTMRATRQEARRGRLRNRVPGTRDLSEAVSTRPGGKVKVESMGKYGALDSACVLSRINAALSESSQRTLGGWKFTERTGFLPNLPR
jgi:hypothetical protein